MEEAQRSRCDGVNEQWEGRVDSRLDALETFKSQHLSVCHVDILKWQAKMWGKWLIVTGIAAGVGLVVGWFLSFLTDFWPLR